MEWRLTNENRVIAGFNCRKAVAKIFDSVYVFAFYTDEILIPGGPCSINGLPGMILGVTIPRLFTSWIATKVTLTGVDENIITPFLLKTPLAAKPKNLLGLTNHRFVYEQTNQKKKKKQPKVFFFGKR